ncbi:Uncharacterised protein [Mycobacteroides abscessus subsp. abscessus]|nr:Uncharacterised protein [Mycobacteroides abscessus subsp. abscessus]
MDQGNAAGKSCEECRFFHRGVSAADDGDVLILEEESIAGGTGADAASQQGVLPWHPQVPRCRTHRQDDGSRTVYLVAYGDGLHGAPQGDLVDVLGAEVGAEADGLFAHLIHQVRSHDSLAEAGVVLDLGGGHQGATELGALEHDRLELRAGRIDRRGVPSGSRADDDELVNVRFGPGRRSLRHAVPF